MEETNNIIESLNNKFKSLVYLYEKSKGEVEIIAEENKQLKEKLRKQETGYQELKNKYDTLSLVKAFTASGEDNHEAKIKVNKIVREIDNCIALLNR